jgi:hypothetical protein
MSLSATFLHTPPPVTWLTYALSTAVNLRLACFRSVTIPCGWLRHPESCWSPALFVSGRNLLICSFVFQAHGLHVARVMLRFVAALTAVYLASIFPLLCEGYLQGQFLEY